MPFNMHCGKEKGDVLAEMGAGLSDALEKEAYK